MNKRFKTLLSLGIVSVVTAASSLPINAASNEALKKEFYRYNTSQYIYENICNKLYLFTLDKLYTNTQKPISPECNQDEESTTEKPEVSPEATPDIPSTPEEPSAPSIPSEKPDTTPDDPSSSEKPSIPSGDYALFQQEVVDLVNQERTNRGLNPLKFNSELSNVATVKSQDMIDKNYFDHTSPTYGSPFDMINQFGISYTAAGENIAMGQKSPQQVMDSWMNSPGHKANILSKDFTEIGVGIASNGSSLYWTQMFIGK